MKIKLLNLYLISIICIAIFIRIFHLQSVPQGFNQSEAAFGYNAYRLMLTGRDEFCKTLPLIIKSFGDSMLAFFSYWIIPFIFVGGLNEISVRVAAITAGVLFIVLNFYNVLLKIRSKIIFIPDFEDRYW